MALKQYFYIVLVPLKFIPKRTASFWQTIKIPNRFVLKICTGGFADYSFFVVIIVEMELETFKITVLPLREKLINISWRMIEDRSDAEDIVQETFLKLWQIREKLDGYNSVEALAVQVAKNLALDKLKQHRPEGTDIALLSLDSGTRNPAEELEQHDTVARIRWLISKLPSLQQTIIRMKDVEGYELAEIAEITGTQVEAVRVNLSRARKKIREQLMKEL